MSRHLRRGLTALLLLGCATAMFARELPREPGKGVMGPGKPRAEAPLLFVLPADTPGGEALELRVMLGSRLLVREVFALPAKIAEGATLDVLVTHPPILKELRTMEAKEAGSLRLVAAVGERTIAEASFGAVDKQSCNLAVKSAVGEPREVETRLNAKTPRRAGVLTIDPECEDACYQTYWDCYARCDERGDSCAICARDLSACLYYCPQVCTEPKSVSYYDVWVPLGAQHFGTYSCASPWAPTTWGEQWEFIYAYYTIYHYQRTEHCDGSHTDTLVSTYPAEGYCWNNTHWQCSPATDQPPYSSACP